MISEHETLENGDGRQRCQVVRWERTFPFSFLSKREYVIGRRMFRGPDGCLYGITKVLHSSCPVHLIAVCCPGIAQTCPALPCSLMQQVRQVQCDFLESTVDMLCVGHSA